MMPAMRGLVGTIGLVGMAWVASACGSSVFACANDAQCQAGAVAGQCEANGFCSFPDDSCPTGQRFGEAAPAEVANACVAAEDGTGTSTSIGEESTTRVEPPDPDPDGILESSTTTAPPEGTSTTSPVDDATTDPAATTDTGQSMTTGPVQTCEVAFIDGFDSEELDPRWSVSAPVATNVFLDVGQLVFEIGPGNEWVLASVLTEVPSLAGGWIRVLVSELEGGDLPVSAGLVVGNDLCQLQLTFEPTGMSASVWNGETQMTTWLGEDDVGVPRWLQIRQDEDGTFHFEQSVDTMAWREVAVGTFPECGDLSNGLVAGMSASGEILTGSAVRAFDQAEACLP
jgi:hypothetical protein